MGRTTLLSRNRAGREARGGVDPLALGMSGDGGEVVFASTAANLVAATAHGHDPARQPVEHGRRGNAPSGFAAISADGRDVAFQSSARNLVPGDRGGRPQVFLRDLVSGRTRQVSRSAAGGLANGSSFPVAVSRHGRFVAFDSRSSNIVAGTHLGRTVVYLRDTARHVTTRVSPAGAGAPCYGTGMTPDARDVVFDSKAGNLVPGDTSAAEDVFVADRAANTLTRVSVAAGGGGQHGSGSTYLAGGSISGDGSRVAFDSLARDLVPGDTNAVYDVFVRDLASGSTIRVSVSTAGLQGDRRSLAPAIAADGRAVAFLSSARDLVRGDTNGLPDVFVRGPLPP